jgi:DNA-binding transcriptional MerR regulator
MENRNYSQITFEFSDVPANQEAISSVGVGVRVKSLKAEAEPAKADVPATEATEATDISETANTADITEVAEQAQVPAKKSTRGRKSLKALDAEADLVNIPDDETLFQRQYYSIGEVADMFGVNQSLLRFWENEFDIIQPRKNRKGDRHFRPVDIKNLELIYDLLRRRKLTIEGAKDFLKKNAKAKEHFEMIQSLQSLKGFLLEIKAAL